MSAVAAQAARGRGRPTLTRGAFVSAAAAPGYVTPGVCLMPDSVSVVTKDLFAFWHNNVQQCVYITEAPNVQKFVVSILGLVTVKTFNVIKDFKIK